MSTKSDDDFFVTLFAFFMILPAAAWSGFVLTKLWGWFIVPLGVPMIGVWQAAGLFVITSWMSGVHTRDDGDRRAGETLALMALVPAFAWAAGGIYHVMMAAS